MYTSLEVQSGSINIYISSLNSAILILLKQKTHIQHKQTITSLATELTLTCGI